jgi:hypothetical protein
MNKESLLEKIESELSEVRKEITELDLHDEMIPTLSGWELALKWVIKQVREEANA